MIKNFETYVNEDYFSKLASRKDSSNVRKENEITEDFVRSFVHEDYEEYIRSITIGKENGKTIVDVNGSFLFGEDVEEIPFQFGKVTGDFDCSGCKKLTSLEGCPKKVGGRFDCNKCAKLKSLKGCPEKVGGYFDCSHCTNLTSLEGCPKEVGGMFDCSHCQKLTSLKGCSKEVGGDFYCDNCKKLKSITGCPKYVGGDFVCQGFTEEEVRTLCNVKGEIAV